MPSRLSRRALRSGATLAACLSLAGSSLAAPAFHPTKLDPNVLRVVRKGLVGPLQRGRSTRGRATVLIEAERPVDAGLVAELERTGARVATVDGRALTYGRFAVAEVDVAAALALEASPLVTRIHNASTRGPLPLDHSAELVRLADARGSRPALDLLTGKGIVVGDVDSDVDVFHPTFFRGDAGYFDWIDVDGDGRFAAGVDALDLNRNGKADPGETAQPLLAATTDFYGKAIDARTAAWDPGTDWLYLDTDASGARDFGPPAFDDTAPAFGEPLFVPDDVNKNGALDPGERVVRLGTSKIRSAYVHIGYGYGVDQTFTRGKDLATLPVDFTKSKLYGFSDSLHATGVLSIVAGDVPLVGRRWVGMAPEVDVVLAFDVEDTGAGLPLKGTTWVLQQKPDVMLYELAPWTGEPLDGTDPLSKLIDASSVDAHVIHTCPTGDQASAHKHAQATVAAGQSASLPFTLPHATPWGATPFTYVEVSLNVRGGAVTSASLIEPGGASHDLIHTTSSTLSTGADLYATVQTSERGTQLVNAVLYLPQSNPGDVALPEGAWKVQVGGATTATTVDAYVMDDLSSWELGVGWDAPARTDTSTIGLPSVADHCIAVGAHPNHVQTAGAPWFDASYSGGYDVPASFIEAQGEVRAYSPRGPRIDLAQKPDVLAPDNPWAAAPHAGTGASITALGAFSVFGGTSGASPHVTGVAALLAQAGIRGDDARDAIRNGAVHDATTGATWNKDYGFGRLDAAAALGVTTTASPPTVKLTVSPLQPALGDTLTLTPVAANGDGTAADLEAKWDDGYDGTWDTPYAPVAARTVTADTLGASSFKVRVRDAGGRIAEAVVRLQVGATTSSGGGSHDDGGCGCHTGTEAPSGSYGLLFGAAAIALVRRRSKRAA